MPIRPVLGGGVDHRRDERTELLRRAGRRSARAPTAGSIVGGDDAGGDGVLEVVADVGDAVGPADTTSPSGVAGAGRLHEWLRMPSSVSAHRLSGARVTSAPHTAWS